MGQRGVLLERHNRVEGRLFGAQQTTHLVFDFSGEIALRHAGPGSCVERAGEGLGVDIYRFPDGGDLRRGLHHPPLFDGVAERFQSGIQRQRALQVLPTAVGHPVVFKPDPAEFGQPAGERLFERFFGDHDLDAVSFGFRGRLEGVAGVGEERGLFRGHQQQGVAAGEAGEVADVGQEGDERGVEFERRGVLPQKAQAGPLVTMR